MKLSLIIPVLNEEKGLEDILSGISAQTLLPNEVIFVDAGSNDKTVKIIEEWGLRNPKIITRILIEPGAYPGRGRNVGVQNAQYEMVVFLDAGIRPAKQWIESLVRAKSDSAVAVWGACRMLGSTPVGRLLASYSFGHGSVINYALPGAMFEKQIFNEIGFLREDLRAAEDVVWREKFISRYGLCPIAQDAVIEYSSFPSNVVSAYKKWFSYSYYTALANRNSRQQVLYSIFFLSLLMTFFFNVKIGLGLLLTYLILRGVVDPIRRSKTKPWFQDYSYLLLCGPVFVFFLDFSKWVGFIKGSLTRK